MKHKFVIFTIVLLLVSLTSAYAGSERKIGTAGAQELLIPVGSRGAAMGGAVVAGCHGIEAIYWNPAGLASLDGTEAMFMHLPYIADVDVNYGAIGTTIEDFGSIALAAKVVSIGEIEETTEAQPEGTGSIFNPTFTVIGLTYASNLTANVQFGASASFINETIFEVSASGIVFDFGVIYTPQWRGVSMGIVLKNYGPDMKFEGSGFQRTYEIAGQRRVFLNSVPFELPASINIGVAYDFLEDDMNSVAVCSNFRSNNHSNDMWQGGVEYVYDGKYSLRGGYNYSTNDEWLYGATVGAGVVIDVGTTELTLEYSWTQTETFDDNQFFTMKVNF